MFPVPLTTHFVLMGQLLCGSVFNGTQMNEMILPNHECKQCLLSWLQYQRFVTQSSRATHRYHGVMGLNSFQPQLTWVTCVFQNSNNQLANENELICCSPLQVGFESFLAKLAVDSLKMNAEEFKTLREVHTQDWVIDEVQRRSFEKGLPNYNLRGLRKALLTNHSVSFRTFKEWQPAKVWDIFY